MGRRENTKHREAAAVISELKIRNFKSLESVDLKLSHFNLLVGTNASGKSNFLDALRFLQGVGNGLSIEETLDGKPATATNLTWDGIRGGAKFAAFRKKDGLQTETVELAGSIPDVSLNDAKGNHLSFQFQFKPGIDELTDSFYETANIYSDFLKQRDLRLRTQKIEPRNDTPRISFIDRLLNLKQLRNRLVASFLGLCAFALSGLLAFELRFDGALPASYVRPMEVALCIWVIVKSSAFIAGGLNLGDWRYTSAYDGVRIILANTAGSLLGGLVMFLLPVHWRIPFSVYILDLLISCVLTLGGRLAVRILIITRTSHRVEGSLGTKDFNKYAEGINGDHILDSLRDIQFLDPFPPVLRDYSTRVARLGEDGLGFAALIHEIELNGSKPALLEWLKELRPDEVSDLFAIPGAVNDYMVAFKEGNTVFPAPAISEGTLRFIALAAAFFQPSMPKVLVIEEIEKGLHPSRLRLLLELMRSQSKRTGTQVFATTHSPTLLNWLTEEDRKTTFVCTRDSETGATRMRSLAEVPKLEELIQKNYNLDQLFEEGWLESVLHES